MDFEAPDLRQDPRASCYVKDETVRVEFARGPGSLASREGLNHYRAADALIVGSGGGSLERNARSLRCALPGRAAAAARR